MDGTTQDKLAALRGEISRLEAAEKDERRRSNREERARQARILAMAGISVQRRVNTRFWDLVDGGRLLAVTVYRRGAVEAGVALAMARGVTGASEIAA